MEPELRASEPQRVMELENIRVADVGNDGRFLAVQLPEEPAITHLQVVFNWFEELKRLAPVN